MGIIKAAASAVGSSPADQWLEVIEPDEMGESTVLTRGVKKRSGSNVKGSQGFRKGSGLIIKTRAK